MKMLISERFAHTARTGGVLALVGVLAWGCVMAAPSAVFADDPAGLKAELEAASSKLDAMYEKAAAVSEELNGTKIALGSTERDIEQAKLDIESKRAELAAAQDDLSGRVVDDYKGRGVSLLSMFLGSSSLDEMMARITYANKVAEADRRAIASVRSIQRDLVQRRSDLEAKRDEQRELLEQQEERSDELQLQISSAESYVESLGDQVRAALEAQRAEEALREQEEAQSVMGGGALPGDAPQEGTDAGGGPQKPTPGPSGPGELSSEQRQVVVNAALSMVGGRYVFGGYDPANRTFDCSGLVQYCYAQVGIGLDHYTESQKRYCTKSISEARPGDIVYRRNHTGIYIGNGRTVEAHSPAEGIGWGSASRFVSCGSPLP